MKKLYYFRRFLGFLSNPSKEIRWVVFLHNYPARRAKSSSCHAITVSWTPPTFISTAPLILQDSDLQELHLRRSQTICKDKDTFSFLNGIKKHGYCSPIRHVDADAVAWLVEFRLRPWQSRVCWSTGGSRHMPSLRRRRRKSSDTRLLFWAETGPPKELKMPLHSCQGQE